MLKWYAALPYQSSLKRVLISLWLCQDMMHLVAKKKESFHSTGCSFHTFPLEEGIPPCSPLVWISTADLQASCFSHTISQEQELDCDCTKQHLWWTPALVACATHMWVTPWWFSERIRSWPQWTGARKVVVAETLGAPVWHPGCVLLQTALMAIWRHRGKDALHTSKSHHCIAVMMYHKVRKNTWGAEVSRHKSLWAVSSAEAHACLFEAGTRPLCFGDSKFMIIDRG